MPRRSCAGACTWWRRPIRDLGRLRSPRPRAAADPAVVAYAGRITPEKGLAVVVEALGRTTSPAPIELCIAGVMEDDAYWEHCLAVQAVALAANPRLTIRVLGHLDYDGTDELFRRADVVTIPSQWPEPLGAVALEAMSAGAAVVAAAIGGLGSTLRHGRSGSAGRTDRRRGVDPGPDVAARRSGPGPPSRCPGRTGRSVRRPSTTTSASSTTSSRPVAADAVRPDRGPWPVRGGPARGSSGCDIPHGNRTVRVGTGLVGTVGAMGTSARPSATVICSSSRINRPEVMNALHPPANAELSEVFDEFAADPDLWVAIITGAGDRAFSAGNDLKYTAAGGDRERRRRRLRRDHRHAST